ncbi:hypothetical protein F1880_000645 [Penicillium rolfsii]|nr:hypothetical protein F1880_000645 [Penicillium rolfsii]
MSDNAHPGVRSLLAKFENSQSPITSPPSRGRSPGGSDTPGSARQLSKVRASFVTVEGAIQSSPGSPLRKTSGRSDSPGIFGPKINADEIESRRQNNVVSPTPGGHGRPHTSTLDGVVDEAQVEKAAIVATERKVSDSQRTTASADSAAPPEATPAKKETSASSAPPSTVEKARTGSKTVSKRPSNVHTAKQNTTAKPTPHATTSTSSRTTTSNGTAKPTSAREVAKERANALAHKPSRPSLNPANKTTSRTTRGATPSADALKSSTGSTVNKAPSKSPTRPARLPSSTTAQTQSSNAKHGSASPASGRTEKPAATLTRKPSTLKSAVGPTGAVRRQSSRPSLPAQAAPERPSSRVSDIGAKPVNESFLARMMRPTASSASKTHEKTEVKPPTKPAASKPSRPSMGRPSDRGVAHAKAKPVALKPQSEKVQPASKESTLTKEENKVTQQKEESDKENVEEVTAVIPEGASVTETNNVIIEEPEPHVSAEANVADVPEKPTEPVIAEAEPETSLKSIVRPTEQSVEPTVTEAAGGVSSEPLATSAPEASHHQQETTKDIEVPIEIPAAETAKKSYKQEEEETAPAANIVEDVTAETPIEINEEEQLHVSQPESEAPKEKIPENVVEPSEPIAAEDVTKTKEKPTLQPEPELPKHTETLVSASIDDAPEITEDMSSTQPSEKIQEPKESIPVVESAAPAKSDTVDIDFASLALS